MFNHFNYTEKNINDKIANYSLRYQNFTVSQNKSCICLVIWKCCSTLWQTIPILHNKWHIMYKIFLVCNISDIFCKGLPACLCHIWYIPQSVIHVHSSYLSSCKWFYVAGGGLSLTAYMIKYDDDKNNKILNFCCKNKWDVEILLNFCDIRHMYILWRTKFFRDTFAIFDKVRFELHAK